MFDPHICKAPVACKEICEPCQMQLRKPPSASSKNWGPKYQPDYRLCEGKSKRLAKRQAADNMLIRLKALNIVTDDEEEAVKGSKKPEDDASYRSSTLYDRESDEDELIIDPQNVSLKDDTHMKMSYKAADSSEYAELKEEKILNISSASHDRESDEDELIVDAQNASLNDDTLMKMNSKATDSTEYAKLKEEKIVNVESFEIHADKEL
ncbi:hypothetical protein TNIN_344141 [Trichonephila inaurata madagascariensis]|uniref:Uncharacterized protein n=1 Tax=Trichonephila inaurata madagascariensis TaxID=2747483 RepID=A0A8X6Y7J6_9ARAC|nr:hypothetical protein TNIN_344141 [Trichonephila inaurata madagascariensis]